LLGQAALWFPNSTFLVAAFLGVVGIVDPLLLNEFELALDAGVHAMKMTP
jgi:hypothetical protein